jgi:hypothetical protein
LSEDASSKAVELINLADKGCRFFCDQHSTPFVFMKNPGLVLRLRGREFKVWLVKQFYDSYSQAVSSDALAAAMNVLEAEAFESERIRLSTRCSMDGERRLIIDLCDKNEEAVMIEPGSWRIAKLDAPRFRRYTHMLPMQVATEGADLREFVKFWRLKDPDDDVILVGYIGHMFVSEIPKAINVAIGPKGSTKTSAQRAIRQLVDPSSVEDMTIGEKGREFVQQLAHHYAPLFDNVSRLQAWQADDLCRAATGAGFTKRELYTDEEDVIFQYKRSVLINGINTPTQRGDFLDRSVLFEFARVPKGGRLEDSKVTAKVVAWLPRLRRSIFDALAAAMSLLDQVRTELQELPRMADFAVWGEAFCRAVGYPPFAFYNRLMRKVDETSTIALENDVIAELLFKLFEDDAGRQYLTGKDEVEGTASQLLKVLQKLNEDIKYVSAKELPEAPESFSRRLGELEADLGEVGIKIERKKTTGGKRRLIVRRLKTPPTPEDSGILPLPPLPPLRTDETKDDDGGGNSGGSQNGAATLPPLPTEHNETKPSGGSGASGAIPATSTGEEGIEPRGQMAALHPQTPEGGGSP